MPPRRRGLRPAAGATPPPPSLSPTRYPPLVHEHFSEMVRLISPVPQAVLMAVGDRRWVERATRIRDTTFVWIQRVQEWKVADQAVVAARDPETRAAAVRYAEVCRLRAEVEQRILAKRIYDEASVAERRRMPSFPLSQSADFIQWARTEAKSEDPRRALRWEGLLGVLPTGAPLNTTSWPSPSLLD
ncbi:hypothetical protein VPH35_060321 [Triticum aestivum]